MNKIEAIEALQKEYHYSEILVEDEFVKQEDGTTVRNKLYDIADAFGIKLPVVTFQPDPNDPKGPMPNHTEECITNENWRQESPCACWEISYTGIAVMDVVDRIGQLYDVYSSKFGRGSAQREKLGQLHELITDMMEIPREKLEEIVNEEAITIDTSKPMISIPLED
jgi:hypothetical protein